MTVLTRFLCALALLLTTASMALADYPARPITITVGFAPGGTSDVAARILSERLTRSLGVAVVVDNKPGAGGSIAAAATAAATPDGYRIMLSDPGAFAINPIMQPQNAKYDPLTDFTPIALVGQSPLILVVPASKPFMTAKELDAYLKANSSRASYASSGPAGISQFGAEVYLKRAGDLSAVHVPYRGGAPMLLDLIAGRIHFAFDNLASLLGPVAQGQIRALAVTGKERSPLLPEVPTTNSTYPELEIVSWGGLVGPAGIARPIVDRLATLTHTALQDDGLKRVFAEQGATPMWLPPAAFAAFQQQQQQVLGALVRKVGASAN